MMRRLMVLAVILAGAPACLVLNVNPLYDDDTLTWEPDLVGAWQNTEDKSSIQVDRGEWKSYSIRYVHPIETGHLTGYLTTVGDSRYLDVMPSRGEDRGAFLVPVHGLFRVRLAGVIRLAGRAPGSRDPDARTRHCIGPEGERPDRLADGEAARVAPAPGSRRRRVRGGSDVHPGQTLIEARMSDVEGF
jgi:hypothetical protein